jgi:hypothetical protein
MFIISLSCIIYTLRAYPQKALVYGTDEAYNFMIDSQRRARESAERWDNAVKLTLFEDKKIKDSDQSNGIDISNSNLSIGDTGKMSYLIFKIESILDSTNCVITIGSAKEPRSFVLSEYPTDKLVDNMKVVLADEVEIAGVRQIENRKLLVLKLLTQIKLPTKNRWWHSSDGRTINGSVKSIDLDSKTITLVRSDGKEFLDFPLSRLRNDESNLLYPQHKLKKPKVPKQTNR